MEINYMETISTPPAPRSLGRALNFATAAMNRACQEMLEPHGLMLAQWVILSALWRSDGLAVSQLAHYTGNNLPASSRIVDRMVRSGLVTRRADPSDRRTVRVHLTEAGRDLRHLSGFHEQVNARLMAGFTPSETDFLFEMLERVLANATAAPAASKPRSGG